MKANLEKALEGCLVRLKEGQDIETCLAAYPELRGQLEPLLGMASALSALPRVSPSDEYRELSRARLLARLREPAARTEKPERAAARPGRPAGAWYDLKWWFGQPARVAISVALALIIALAGTIFSRGNLFWPPPALASPCTLSILSGTVAVQYPGAASWAEAADNTVLAPGSRVWTAPDSYALLTFFEGTTVKLEPDTDLLVARVEGNGGDQPPVIVLKQWLGKTWSRVVKMVDPGSHYEIQTPSAAALVRGTLFTTEVNQTGATVVKTTQGLVSVAARGKEVLLPAGQQSAVVSGKTPSEVVAVPPPASQITITVNLPGAASVVDPTGSSTGYLPDGTGFNQIPGSISSPPDAGPQVISLPQPLAGEYLVVLRSGAGGAGQFRLEGTAGGSIVFSHSGTITLAANGERLIRLHLTIAGGQLTGATVGEIEAASGQKPEKVVTPEPVARGNDKGTPPGQDDKGTPPGQDDKGTPPGQDDKGTPPGQDDKGTPPGQDDKGTPPGQDDKQKPGKGNGQGD